MFEHIAYHETTLPNGLRVLTAQNVSIPVLESRCGLARDTDTRIPMSWDIASSGHMLFAAPSDAHTLRPSWKWSVREAYFNAFTNQASVNYEMQMMSSDWRVHGRYPFGYLL